MEPPAAPLQGEQLSGGGASQQPQGVAHAVLETKELQTRLIPTF